jgi:hypothetical protein
MLRLSVTVASNIGETATTFGKFRSNKLEWFIFLGQKVLLGTNALAYWAQFVSFEENEALRIRRHDT